MTHCMLDLETFGVAPGCVVRSIGAAWFDLDGHVHDTFYANIDHDSCVKAGLVIDPRTAEWWCQQSKAAQDALLVDARPLGEIVRNFGRWFLDRKLQFIWSHGAAFDVVIWEAASRAIGAPTPWKFHNVRDARTVHDLFDFDIRDVARVGVHHNALDDALFQVECVAQALAKGRAPVAVGVFS